MKKIVTTTSDSLNYNNTANLEGAIITNINFDGDIMMLTIKCSDGEWVELQVRSQNKVESLEQRFEDIEKRVAALEVPVQEQPKFIPEDSDRKYYTTDRGKEC